MTQASRKIWKITFAKKENFVMNRKRSLFRNHSNCSLRTSTKGLLFRTFNTASIHSISKVYYVTAVLTLLSVLELTCPGGIEQFQNVILFKKLPLAISRAYSFFDSSKHNFFLDVLGRDYYSLVYAQLWFIQMLWILMCVALKKL